MKVGPPQLLAVPLRVDSVPFLTRNHTQISDLRALERSTESVATVLYRELGYVHSVLAGDTQLDVVTHSSPLDAFAATASDLENGGFDPSLQEK